MRKLSRITRWDLNTTTGVLKWGRERKGAFAREENATWESREAWRCFTVGLEVGGGRDEPRHAALEREEAWKWFSLRTPKVPALQPRETDFRLKRTNVWCVCFLIDFFIYLLWLPWVFTAAGFSLPWLLVLQSVSSKARELQWLRPMGSVVSAPGH